MLFFSFLLILFSFVVICHHSLLSYNAFFLLSSSRPVCLSLLQLLLSPLSPFPLLTHSLFLSPPSLVFIICWRAECGRMLVIWPSDCIGHGWMIPNLVPKILSLWVVTLVITNGGWYIPGTTWEFHELHRARVTQTLRRRFSFLVFLHL